MKAPQTRTKRELNKLMRERQDNKYWRERTTKRLSFNWRKHIAKRIAAMCSDPKDKARWERFQYKCIIHTKDPNQFRFWLREHTDYWYELTMDFYTYRFRYETFNLLEKEKDEKGELKWVERTIEGLVFTRRADEGNKELVEAYIAPLIFPRYHLNLQLYYGMYSIEEKHFFKKRRSRK